MVNQQSFLKPEFSEFCVFWSYESCGKIKNVSVVP